MYGRNQEKCFVLLDNKCTYSLVSRESSPGNRTIYTSCSVSTYTQYKENQSSPGGPM